MLFDIDKNSGGRTDPIPNAHDVVVPEAVMAKSTVSTQYSSNQTANGYVKMQNTNLIANDGVTNRAIFGFNKNTGTWGSFAVQPGQDILTAPPSSYAFSSDFDSFKIVQKSSSSIPSFTIGSGQSNYSTITIPHGLGYAPIAQVYVKGNMVNQSTVVIASSYVPLPIFYSQTNAIVAGSYFFPNTSVSPSYYGFAIVFAVDANNLYVQAASNSTATADTIAAIPFTYFLLRETAT